MPFSENRDEDDDEEIVKHDEQYSALLKTSKSQFKYLILLLFILNSQRKAVVQKALMFVGNQESARLGEVF